MNNIPSAKCKISFAIHHKLIAMSHMPCAIRYKLYAIRHLPFAIYQMLLTLCYILLIVTPSPAIDLEEINILKVSGREKAAVIMSSAEKMYMIKEGDRLCADASVLRVSRERNPGGECSVLVKEITEGRVVLEKVSKVSPEKIIILSDGKEQRLIRIKKHPGRMTTIYKTQTLKGSFGPSQAGSEKVPDQSQ